MMLRYQILDPNHPDPHTGQAGVLFRLEPASHQANMVIMNALKGPVGVVQGVLYPDGRWWVPSGTDLGEVIEGWEVPWCSSATV